MKLFHFFRKFKKSILVIAAIAGVIVVVSYIDPQTLIESIGVRNVYIFTFLFSIIGGVSTFTSVGFYATLFASAAGGLSPLTLATISAPGVLIGDLLFWYAGAKGRPLAQFAFGPRLTKFSQWLERRPSWLIPLIIYLYTGLTPFPGDILMLALASARYPLRYVLLPTLLGNFTLTWLIAYYGTHNSG